MGENAKFDQEKNRLDLVFPSIIEELGFIRTYGVKKYKDPENWCKIDDAKQRYIAAAMRHFEAWRAGEKFDKESGFRHLAHCACNIMFLIELERRDERNNEEKERLALTRKAASNIIGKHITINPGLKTEDKVYNGPVTAEDMDYKRNGLVDEF